MIDPSTPHTCPSCGYAAEPSLSGKCPSCGKPFDAPASPQPESEAQEQIDFTRCMSCGASNGQEPFPTVAGLPWCPTCREGLYNRPFPGWIKATLAGLLALLVFSYFHGAQYFQAGRSLVLGERLVEQAKFAEAVPFLDAVIQVAPDCEKCLLLTAKAKLLSGDPAGAYQNLMSHNGGMFEKGPLFSEVEQIFSRLDQAAEKMNQAREFYDQDKLEEAEAAVREAAGIFPALPGVQETLRSIQAGAAFLRKDYDEFLRIAEEAWQGSPQSSMVAGQVASALACKFAVTGDAAYKIRSEEFLAKAGQLAVSDEDKTLWTEYGERIRHRLRTREIIDQKEYNRRYRPATQEAKP